VDSGLTWQKQSVSDFDVPEWSFCGTKEFLYYFLGKSKGNTLCFSRTPVDQQDWTAPQDVVKTFGTSGFIRACISAATDDTAHLCWFDNRHEKKRMIAQKFHKEKAQPS
jgi:hypothetical protein